MTALVEERTDTTLHRRPSHISQPAPRNTVLRQFGEALTSPLVLTPPTERRIPLFSASLGTAREAWSADVPHEPPPPEPSEDWLGRRATGRRWQPLAAIHWCALHPLRLHASELAQRRTEEHIACTAYASWDARCVLIKKRWHHKQ